MVRSSGFLRVLAILCTAASLDAQAQTVCPPPLDPTRVEIHDMVEGHGAVAALGTVAVGKIARWKDGTWRPDAPFQDPRTLPGAQAVPAPVPLGFPLILRENVEPMGYLAAGIVGMRQGGRRLLVIRVSPDKPQLFDVELVDVGSTEDEVKARYADIKFPFIPPSVVPLRNPATQTVSCRTQDTFCSEGRPGSGRAAVIGDYARITLHEVQPNPSSPRAEIPWPAGTEYVYELRLDQSSSLDARVARAIVGMRPGGKRQIRVEFAQTHQIDIELQALGCSLADFAGAPNYQFVPAHPTELSMLANRPDWKRCSTGPLCRDIDDGNASSYGLDIVDSPRGQYARVSIRRWHYDPSAPDFKGARIGEADPPDYGMSLTVHGAWKVAPRISAAVLDMNPGGQRILTLPEVGMTVEVKVRALSKDIAGLGDPAIYQMLALPDRKSPDSADLLMRENDPDPAALASGAASGSGGAASAYVDARRAYAQTRKAAEQGSPAAQFTLSQYYAEGRGIGSNLQEAAAWCRKAAEQGYAPAQKGLGDLYTEGHGVAQDARAAAAWYLKAGEQGNAEAQLRLGQIYQFGKGVPQDDAQARPWYVKAAAQQQSDAQNNLAWMLENGWGGPKDEAGAVRLYRLAAEKNNPYGQFNLGRMYALGKAGLPKDEREAVIWTRKAAEQQLPDAEYALGMFYRDGLGVTRDGNRAKELITRAMYHGSKDAEAYLNALNPPPPRTIIYYMSRPMPVIW